MTYTFLRETLLDIENSGHTPADIIFIGSEATGHSCTWEEFRVLADFEYGANFGVQEIATDLIIVFSDKTTMWRMAYDGSEQWCYSPPFTMPAVLKPIKRLTCGSCRTLQQLNEKNGDD